MKNPIIFIIPLLALAGCSGGDAPLYKDPAQPAEKRAEDLTSRMTLEQKVAQMCQWVGLEHMKSAEKEPDGRGACTTTRREDSIRASPRPTSSR